MSRTVAVIGGGYGGSAVAKALDSEADVVLIDPRDAFVNSAGSLRALAQPDWAHNMFFPEDPAHVGLAWLLAQDGVTGPIIGPRTVEQLDGSLRALTIRLDDGTLDELNELFPPPAPNGAKPAPEAYAW